MVTSRSSTCTSLVRKSAPMVALYWLLNFLFTYLAQAPRERGATCSVVPETGAAARWRGPARRRAARRAHWFISDVFPTLRGRRGASAAEQPVACTRNANPRKRPRRAGTRWRHAAPRTRCRPG